MDESPIHPGSFPHLPSTPMKLVLGMDKLGTIAQNASSMDYGSQCT